MRSAALAGAREHRSAAQQIEYWAALGREVAPVLDLDRLLAVQAGLAQLHVEPVHVPPVPPEQVFAALEAGRRSGDLSASVTAAPLRYQASAIRPGLLERIESDGRRSVGHFREGVFVPCDALDP